MKEIELTQGKVALVDDEDFEELNKHKWRAMNNHGRGWYAVRRSSSCNGKWHTIYMHREIMNAQPGQEVDHRNRKGLDNQRKNLRFCTCSQNQANAKKRVRCSSQYKGVNWNKQHDKWQAYIKVHGKQAYLGYFDDEIAAACAYDKAATERFGEFAHPNFPGGREG